MLIRNRKTGQFFNQGEWVESVERGQVFRSALEALKVKNSYKLENVELYHLMFDNPSELDFVLPL